MAGNKESPSVSTSEILITGVATKNWVKGQAGILTSNTHNFLSKMALNKLGVDKVDLKDKRVLIR